jgi:hypothetical protein
MFPVNSGRNDCGGRKELARRHLSVNTVRHSCVSTISAQQPFYATRSNNVYLPPPPPHVRLCSSPSATDYTYFMITAPLVAALSA